jgi:hypothetical protein
MLWSRARAAERHHNWRTGCGDAQSRLKGESRLGARAGKDEDRCARGGGTGCDTTLCKCLPKFCDRVATTREQLL